MEFKKEHLLYFGSSGRLVRVLGRESISNPNIALIEAVKNAYDADAKEVNISFEEIKAHHGGKIIISDDGTGMTEEDIRDRWMTTATDNKLHEPFTKKYKRRKIGEKGIARFAFSTLAQALELITKPAGATKGYRLFIDWNRFDEEGASFEKTPVDFKSSSKKKAEHGTTITLSGLRQRWDKELLEKFIREAELITPPTSKPDNFGISVHVPDFPDIGDQRLSSRFLRVAPYYFEAKLDAEGYLQYRIKTPKGSKKYSKIKTTRYSCGPVDFNFWFLPRDKGLYDRLGVSLQGIQVDEIKKFLDDWGGIKLYRDNLRVKPYGDSGNDWLKLDSLRVDSPSIIPDNTLVFGYVRISQKGNSAIVDTSTREGVVDNVEFRDLRQFAIDGVKFFGTVRRAVEDKGKHKREGKGQKKSKTLKEVLPKSIVPKPRQTFIDFGKKYPEIFYFKLEDEINIAFQYNLPNAVLMLVRKVIENLVYNLMEERFSSEKDLRWDTRRNRPLEFSKLVSSLSDRASSFDGEQKGLVLKAISLIGRFRREANLNTHQIIDYLDDRSELKTLKIPDIIELLLKLIRKNRE
ncbi:MAG: ATP-binding protein [Candidatus Liptonbacteria bacterium]|nr:ATP-binding protein [Candidatus Liptonbacteria bacterium]